VEEEAGGRMLESEFSIRPQASNLEPQAARREAEVKVEGRGWRLEV
jgi:hypothetical protein